MLKIPPWHALYTTNASAAAAKTTTTTATLLLLLIFASCILEDGMRVDEVCLHLVFGHTLPPLRPNSARPYMQPYSLGEGRQNLLKGAPPVNAPTAARITLIPPRTFRPTISRPRIGSHPIWAHPIIFRPITVHPIIFRPINDGPTGPLDPSVVHSNIVVPHRGPYHPPSVQQSRYV